MTAITGENQLEFQPEPSMLRVFTHLGSTSDQAAKSRFLQFQRLRISVLSENGTILRLLEFVFQLYICVGECVYIYDTKRYTT